MDRHPRGGLPRAEGVLQKEERGLPAAPSTKILLPLHLRILLQPLRRRLLPAPDRLPDALPGMARLPDLRVRAGVDRQRLHELLQPLAAGHQARERRHRRRADQGRKRGREQGPAGRRGRVADDFLAPARAPKGGIQPSGEPPCRKARTTAPPNFTTLPPTPTRPPPPPTARE